MRSKQKWQCNLIKTISRKRKSLQFQVKIVEARYVLCLYMTLIERSANLLTFQFVVKLNGMKFAWTFQDFYWNSFHFCWCLDKTFCLLTIVIYGKGFIIQQTLLNRETNSAFYVYFSCNIQLIICHLPSITVFQVKFPHLTSFHSLMNWNLINVDRFPQDSFKKAYSLPPGSPIQSQDI